MNRRSVLFGAGGLIAWPFVARAQQLPMPVLGDLNRAAAGITPTLKGFHTGLGEAGFIENRNLAIEYGYADWQTDRLPALAADLVERRVTVIFATTGPAPALAAKAATSTIPIVFLNGSDPVKTGLVASLSHPGGNVTGSLF